MNLNIFQISKIIKNDLMVGYYISSIFSFLSKKLADYPDCGNWYHKKVISGLYEGKREILCAKIDDQIAGITILKKDMNEKKICSLYVLERFRHRGIGNLLFKKSFDILETSSPLLSVSDLNHNQFKKLFRYFGFKNEYLLKNKYRTGVNEIVFNGMLEKEPFAVIEKPVIANKHAILDSNCYFEKI